MKKALLYVFILLCITTTSYGQYVVLEDSTNMNELVLNECGDADTITTYIRVAGGTISGNTVLVDSFPSNFVVSGFIINPAITLFQGIGTNQAAIKLNTATLNASPFGVRVQYLVRVKCGANGMSTARHKYTFSHATLGTTKIGQDLVSAIKAPVLILESFGVINEPDAVNNQAYTRYWRLRNTGTNSKINQYTFSVDYQDGLEFDTLEIDGVGVVPTLVGDRMFYTINKPLREFSDFPGDTVVIEETYRVKACSKFSLFSEIKAEWGCFDKPICKTVKKFASTQVPGTVPNVKVKLLSTNKGCYGSWDTVTVGYINEGTGIATNLKLRIDQTYPNGVSFHPYETSIAYMDTASLVYDDSHFSNKKLVIDSVAEYVNPRSFWTGTDAKVAIAYVSVDSISAGDTVKVTFRTFRGYYDNSFCSATDIVLNTSLEYQNNCGLVDYVIDETNLLREIHRYGGKTDYKGPNYLFFGDTGVFQFTTPSSARYNHYNDANDYFAVYMDLPPGILWDKDSSLMESEYVPGGGVANLVADSIFYNQATGELQAFYKDASIIRNRRLKPKFYVDCNVPGAGGVQNIKIQYFNVRSISGCGFTKVPISCEDAFAIPVICPGPCPRGGISAVSTNFERVNFGRPDNNNDGIPDAAGSIDMSKVERDKLAPRDTMRFAYKAGVTIGLQSPTAKFPFGYIEVKVADFGDRLDYLRSDLSVDDRTFIPFTATNLPVSKTKVGNITTFKFDISGNTPGFPVGFFYDHLDTLTFNAYFVYNKDVQENADFDGNNFIETDVYVSDVASPTADTNKYTCLNLPGAIRLVNVFKGYNGRLAKPQGCVSSAVISDYHQSVGNCCSNYNGSTHFQYEYRLFSTLDSVSVQIPTGYRLDSTALSYLYTAGAFKTATKKIHGVMPISQNGEWFTFLLTNYYDFAGGSLVPSTTGSQWQVINYVTPTCEVPNNDTKNLNSTDIWTGRGQWTGIDNTGHTTPQYRGQIVNRFSANLSIANYGAVVLQTHKNNFFWDVKVQNNSNTSDATNVWVSPFEGASDIKVDSIYVKVGSTFVPLTKSGDLYQLGSLAKNGGFKIARVYANYSECIPDDILIYSGWDCEGYPANLAAANGACASANVGLRIVPYEPLIQTDLIESPGPSTSICDTLTWVVSISQRQLAPAFDISLDMIIPNNGTGARLLPGTAYKYPFNELNYVTINPEDLGSGTFRFHLSDSITELDEGLNTVDSVPLNEVYVKVRMVTDCDFISGSDVRFLANGKSKCGKVLTPDAEFSEINIGFDPSPKLLIASSLSGEIRPCNAPVDVKITVANYELGAVLRTDSVILVLPADSRYIPSSTVFSYKPLDQTEPNISMVGGRQRLVWSAYPVGVLDSSLFTLKIQSDDSKNCSTDFRLETISKSNYSRTCRQTTCDNEYQNSYKQAQVPVYKPNLTYTPGSGTLEVEVDTTVNPGRSDFIEAAGLQFLNNGNDTAQLPVLTFYNDLNSNNKLDPTDRFLLHDTMSKVNPGNMISYSKTFYFANGVLTDDTVKILATQACNCTDIVVAPSFNYTPLPVEYLFFRASLLDQDISLIEWATTMEFNSERFDVYRSFGNPNSFVKVKTVEAAGNSNQLVNYQINDDISMIPAGPIYYKLVQVDNNGIQKHTDFVKITKKENREGKQVTLYPNPANNSVTLILSNFADGNVSLDLLDVTGRLVRKIDLNVVEGVSSEKIDLTNIPAGVYTLTGMAKTIRLVIKH